MLFRHAFGCLLINARSLTVFLGLALPRVSEDYVPPPAPTSGVSCASDAPCGAYTCAIAAGFCFTECVTDATCVDGWTCDGDGACVYGGEVASGSFRISTIWLVFAPLAVGLAVAPVTYEVFWRNRSKNAPGNDYWVSEHSSWLACTLCVLVAFLVFFLMAIPTDDGLLSSKVTTSAVGGGDAPFCASLDAEVCYPYVCALGVGRCASACGVDRDCQGAAVCSDGLCDDKAQGRPGASCDDARTGGRSGMIL